VANPERRDVKVVTAAKWLVTATGVGETELTVWRGTK